MYVHLCHRALHIYMLYVCSLHYNRVLIKLLYIDTHVDVEPL